MLSKGYSDNNIVSCAIDGQTSPRVTFKNISNVCINIRMNEIFLVCTIYITCVINVSYSSRVVYAGAFTNVDEHKICHLFHQRKV